MKSKFLSTEAASLAAKKEVQIAEKKALSSVADSIAADKRDIHVHYSRNQRIPLLSSFLLDTDYIVYTII